VAQNLGVPAYMVDKAAEIKAEWVAGKNRVGLTAGASAPEILVREVIERLNALGIGSVTNLDGAQEKVSFALPKGLGA
jgi:4-hydroxy-3-methylbut-2-enyl diphosphate reductase